MGTGFSKKKKAARAMQQQLAQVSEEVQKVEAQGSAGNGLVTVVLTGTLDLKSIKIKPDCVDPEDVEGLEVLIKAAFEDAASKLRKNNPTSIPGMEHLTDLGLFGKF